MTMTRVTTEWALCRSMWGVIRRAGSRESVWRSSGGGALKVDTTVPCPEEPTYLAMAPGGGTLYVVNELNSTLTACAFDADTGRLDPRESIGTVPPDSTGHNFPSALRASPDGRFVYVANRGHDSIAVVATDPRLQLVATFPCGGEFPRDIAFGDNGRLLYVANERSDLITALAVDARHGGLLPTGQAVAFPGPTCLLSV
jgi:6-phosphogluconolactonase